MRRCCLLLVAMGFAAGCGGADSSANIEASEKKLKEIMLGLHNHHDMTLQLPNGYPILRNGKIQPPGRHRFSWRVQILPFIGEQELYDQFDFDQPWDSEHNLKVAAKMPDVFRSRFDPPETTDAGYVHVDDPEGAFPTAPPAETEAIAQSLPAGNLASISDGLENTIGVIEVASSGIHWAQPTDISLADAIALLQHGKVESPGTARVPGKEALVATMEVSVRRVPIGISAATAKARLTRQGQEKVEY
jgi:hypothetical protein